MSASFTIPENPTSLLEIGPLTAPLEPLDIWWHAANSRDWTEKSFKYIAKVSSMGELTGIMCHIESTGKFSSGFWFIMRQNVPPRLEHSMNIRGGAYSYCAPEGEAFDLFWKYSIALGLKTISENPAEVFQGIVSSPKRDGYYLLKMWTQNANTSDPARLRIYDRRMRGQIGFKRLVESNC
jgi:hypothetical protein